MTSTITIDKNDYTFDPDASVNTFITEACNALTALEKEAVAAEHLTAVEAAFQLFITTIEDQRFATWSVMDKRLWYAYGNQATALRQAYQKQVITAREYYKLDRLYELKQLAYPRIQAWKNAAAGLISKSKRS